MSDCKANRRRGQHQSEYELGALKDELSPNFTPCLVVAGCSKLQMLDRYEGGALCIVQGAASNS
jgi:hypothetical protein